MAFSGFDHRLLAELRRREAGWSQAYLVQRILRAISKTSLFSQHVASLAGMSVELPRTQAVLTSFAATGQPARALVRAHCEAAAHAVARWDVCPELRQSLVDTASMIAVQSNVLDDLKARALGTAAAIGTQLPLIQDVVDDALAKAWHSDVDVSYVDMVADEYACLVATADRDPAALTQDLVRAFRSKDTVDAHTLRSLLLPNASGYRVAVVVHGAAELTRLQALHETAVSSGVREPERLGFGAALGRLRRFTRQIPVNGAACLVACQVDAVDAPSAGRIARREVAELLDQYMAGHRLVALSLGDDVFVSRVDSGESRHIQSHTPTVDRAVPLVSHWPGTLRNGLRMAHVARVTEAPLPAAALAWAALEACGLNKREDIAAALALQAMRQQIVEAHQQLCQGARTAPVELQLIDSHAVTNDFNRLRDLNTWVDLLLPQRDSDSSTAIAARKALTAVAAQTSPLAAQQVRDWSARLSNPVACAQWLEDRQQRIGTFLHALNATRNMSLHTGQFRAFGDVTLGIGGSLVVDFTLEILGNWYRNTDQQLPPAKVIALLARRQRDLVARLQAHDGPLFDLNIAWLTSPASAGMRTPSDG
ncbi:hypothetical protein LWC34_18460 [Kibdelosporangium philippinense]|uniref:Uncharacterized protein n=1 Tax=Kibdelosporangium philippinense TaxID=211113 RepID=A0ABS8ZAA6_9PSEU|nr:hypothetical protein [Kibdelosporangium philippinense]MCE7004791.1 hypothetical protein [Kibdelosporangium philippinense]